VLCGLTTGAGRSSPTRTGWTRCAGAGTPLDPVRDRYLMYVGGADGYTDYPALEAGAGQPSSDSMVALDGPRVA
jgi:N-ethylmaleimide reductase